MLNHIRKELADVMKELHKRLLRTPLTCHLKKTVPGFGTVLPHVVVAEAGDMARFGYSHRRFAAYCLLAPRSWDSGQETDEPAVGRKLGHRGNRTLKWAFLEAARAAVRKGGHWRELYDRHTQGGKKDKNRGYLKVARQLCKLVVREWRKAVSGPEESSRAPQEQPARRSKHRRRGRGQSSTRSGTGALKRPMVEV
jgi:transposase